MRPSVTATLIAVLLLGGAWTGCRQRRSQITEEYEAARAVANMLQIYEWDHPNMPITNLLQAAQALPKGYPHGLHNKFKRFGKHAGFKNSFYEKYVFLPPGMTSPVAPRFLRGLFEGELVFMNAQPFPNSERKLGRILVSRPGNTYQEYRLRWLEEEHVQQMFREIGIHIPKPTPMPPPPKAPRDPYAVPWHVEVSVAFDKLAEYLGMEGKGHVLRNVSYALVIVSSISFTLWIWWRSRKKASDESSA
jgi:hypothetical protein